MTKRREVGNRERHTFDILETARTLTRLPPTSKDLQAGSQAQRATIQFCKKDVKLLPILRVQLSKLYPNSTALSQTAKTKEQIYKKVGALASEN